MWLCWTHLWLNKLVHEHDTQIVDQAHACQHAAQPARPHAHHLTVQRHHLQGREKTSSFMDLENPRTAPCHSPVAPSARGHEWTTLQPSPQTHRSCSPAPPPAAAQVGITDDVIYMRKLVGSVPLAAVCRRAGRKP